MSKLCKNLSYKLNQLYRKIFVKKLKVAFLGTESSGKTSLIRAVFEKTFNENVRLSRGSVLQYNLNGIDYIIYDVPGGGENIGRWDLFYKKCDVFVYVFDSTSNERIIQESYNQLTSLLYRNIWTKRNLLVLGTKNDLPGAMQCKDIILNLNLMDIIDREISCYSVSSLNFINLDSVVNWLEEQANNLKR